MSNNHLLVWNTRGLNSRARRSMVRNIVVQQRASISCLQESKVANFSVSMNNGGRF
jgi:exonuclease III